MARITVEVDDHVLRNAMAMLRCKTEQEAVDQALRRVAYNPLRGNPMSLEEALAMEGTGWEGDLDEMRFNEHADWTDRP
ncbi:MAG TPA: type II toxin-antitoxin system VapB family antitoxin [Thermoleophilaceae bacterium]